MKDDVQMNLFELDMEISRAEVKAPMSVCSHGLIAARCDECLKESLQPIAAKVWLLMFTKKQARLDVLATPNPQCRACNMQRLHSPEERQLHHPVREKVAAPR